MFCVWAVALMVACGIGMSASPQQGPPPPTAPATGFIAGQIVEQPSGRGVAGATVTLAIVSGGRGGGAQRPVITDSQGRFYFANLAAGAYVFGTAKSGYSAVPSAVAVRTTPLATGERITDVKINLVKLGAISGTLRDDAGDPVAGMTVGALRRSINNGRPTMTSVGGARSDDRGAYRISGLQPGDYVVCACTRDPLPLDSVLLTTLAAEPMQLMGVAARALKVGANAASLDDTLRTFGPTLYPSSATVARADRVTVKPGEEKANVDINLTAVKAAHISGTVIGSPSPLNTWSLWMTPSGESDEGAIQMQVRPTVLQPDGRFDFVNVPAGSYILRATVMTAERGAGAPSGTAMTLLGRANTPSPLSIRRDVSDPWLVAYVPIVVGDRDIDGVSVVLKPGGVVSGKVQVTGNATLPPAQSLTRTLVIAAMLNPPPGLAVPVPSVALNADGTFRIFLVPGRYQFSVQGLQGLPTLRSIEVGGVDMTDVPLEVDSEVSDVVLTMSAAPPASIGGTVARTGSAEDLDVLIFPADRRLWAEPAAAVFRYRAAAIARDGSFTAARLSAGDYFIAVVPDAQSVDWQQAPRLEALSKTATKVTLAEGEKKVVEVKR